MWRRWMGTLGVRNRGEISNNNINRLIGNSDRSRTMRREKLITFIAITITLTTKIQIKTISIITVIINGKTHKINNLIIILT
jgi:hypothetical protein